MLLFGHVSITMAAARLSDIVFPSDEYQDTGSGLRYHITSMLKRIRDETKNLDYRILIIGSVLPDIIDKPLFLLFRESGMFTGRSYAHTLLFAILLLTGGIVSKKSWLLTLALADLFHLILDFIWDDPETLFWPLLGRFEPYEADIWFSHLWFTLTHLPEIYIPEILGLMVTCFLAYKVLKARGVKRFIRQGVID